MTSLARTQSIAARPKPIRIDQTANFSCRTGRTGRSTPSRTSPSRSAPSGRKPRRGRPRHEIAVAPEAARAEGVSQRASVQRAMRAPLTSKDLRSSAPGRKAPHAAAVFGSIRANLLEHAPPTLRLARLADVAAMQDQPVVGVAQEAGGDHLHELVLHLPRRLARGDAEPVGDAEDMGVDGQRRFAEGGVEDDVGGLAPDPRQRLERVTVRRNLAAPPLDQRLRQRDDVPGLRPIKPDRLDPLRQPLLAERRHFGRRVGDGEKRLRRLVDGRVRRLRRKDHGDQQGERIDGFEFSHGLGIDGLEPLEHGVGQRRAFFSRCFCRHYAVFDPQVYARLGRLALR